MKKSIIFAFAALVLVTTSCLYTRAGKNEHHWRMPGAKKGKPGHNR